MEADAKKLSSAISFPFELIPLLSGEVNPNLASPFPGEDEILICVGEDEILICVAEVAPEGSRLYPEFQNKGTRNCDLKELQEEEATLLEEAVKAGVTPHGA